MLATESTEHTEKLDKLHYIGDGQDIQPVIGLPDTRQPTCRTLFGDSFVRFFKLFSVTSVAKQYEFSVSSVAKNKI